MATVRRRLPPQHQERRREAELGEPDGEQLHLHHQEPAADRLGDRRADGGGGRGRLQQTAGRQDRVPLSALQVRPQELLQSAGHRDPGRVQDGGERRMAAQARGSEPEQEAQTAGHLQKQPRRDRHLQGVHGSLRADQSHPGLQRVRHLAALQAGGADQEHEPLYNGGELLRPLPQPEIQPVLRLLPEAAEATPRNKGSQAPEHHQEGGL